MAGNDTPIQGICFQTMEARGAKRVKKMSTVHVGKWQFVIKGGGGVRWTSIGIVMYRAHARKRWRATLRGTYFSLKKKKSDRSYVLSLEQDKEKNLDRSSQLYLTSTRSFSYEQFLMSRSNVSHPSTRFLKLNSSSTNGGGSLEIGQK